jgi:hypothetical protein
MSSITRVHENRMDMNGESCYNGMARAVRGVRYQ